MIGTFDRTEVNNLVGLLLLEKIGKIVDNEDNGHDNRLMIVKDNNRGTIEQIIKKLSNLFKELSFTNEVEANIKIVEYLDVRLDLSIDMVTTFKKLNSELDYINTGFNHPPCII